jgi:hypothetical protein
MNPQPELIPIVLTALPVTGFTFGWSSLEYQMQMTISAGRCPVLADKREIGFVMRFCRPFLRIFLLLSDSAHLTEKPKNSECQNHE